MIDCYYTAAPIQFDDDSSKANASRMICYKGVHLYVRSYDANHYQVVGLCTTNPSHYLQKDLKPGALIPLLNYK